jgi:hypothetical protein
VSFVFSADFFASEIKGGAELNDQEVISYLETNGHDIITVHSEDLTPTFIKDHQDHKFIISNFIKLSRESKQCLQNCSYIIYEHDHKYLRTRNPGQYKDFSAPSEEIINSDFYKNAEGILCQSVFHESIIKKNLKLDNIINLGGNLWAEDVLDLFEDLSKKEKKQCCSIMDSPIPSKNTGVSIKFCLAKELNHQLIKNSNYIDFLKELTENDTLVFFPKTPETLSRIIVEARMAGMKVITNSLVGAAHEDWFKLKGEVLINRMREKRIEIMNKIIGAFE